MLVAASPVKFFRPKGTPKKKKRSKKSFSTALPEVIYFFMDVLDEHLIISGDKHLLELKTYKDIQIATPSEATAIIAKLMK